MIRKRSVSRCLLEEFGFFAEDFTEQQVGQTAGSHAKPLIGEPFFAQNLFYNRVVGDGIHDRVNAASGLKTYLNACFFVVGFDGLSHHIRRF